MLPIPGLAEAGIGFRTVGEAIHLRNHVLGRLDAAASVNSADARRAALTFVFTGGGCAGVEALAELQDMAFDACARYPEFSHREMRWILVEAADRILPEVSPAMADYVAALLRRRHIEVRLRTRLTSAEGGRIRLDDGEEFNAGTLVWTAGVAPSSLARQAWGGTPLAMRARRLWPDRNPLRRAAAPDRRTISLAHIVSTRRPSRRFRHARRAGRRLGDRSAVARPRRRVPRQARRPSNSRIC